MSHVGPAAVWPTRSWPLSALTPAQWASWERDGYLIIPDVINASTAVAAGTAIRAFIGANDSDPATWYANTLDIYEDRTPTGARPHHGPCGMVNLCHHQALWDIRQEPRLHRVFADLYGTPRLYVTTDRQHFKPPQHAAFPAWSDPGAVHKGLHWDVDTRRNNWPVPYVVQGVVYLEETTAEQGALRVVPGFHRRLAAWDAEQPADRGAERPEGDAAAALDAEAVRRAPSPPSPSPCWTGPTRPRATQVALAAGAGSLVVWHSLLPHGPAPNLGAAPRVSSYVTMLPVDAGPFLGPACAPGGLEPSARTYASASSPPLLTPRPPLSALLCGRRAGPPTRRSASPTRARSRTCLSCRTRPTPTARRRRPKRAVRRRRRPTPRVAAAMRAGAARAAAARRGSRGWPSAGRADRAASGGPSGGGGGCRCSTRTRVKPSCRTWCQARRTGGPRG